MSEIGKRDARWGGDWGPHGPYVRKQAELRRRIERAEAKGVEVSPAAYQNLQRLTEQALQANGTEKRDELAALERRMASWKRLGIRPPPGTNKQLRRLEVDAAHEAAEEQLIRERGQV